MRFLKNSSRYLLGIALVFAGVGHLSFLRQEFQAQVPVWLALDADFVVLASGVVEILLGIGLIFSGKYVPIFGLLSAGFFLAIFPGNINQYLEGIDAFGLNTDQARLTRLFFQPLLIFWALAATGAVSYLRQKLFTK